MKLQKSKYNVLFLLWNLSLVKGGPRNWETPYTKSESLAVTEAQFPETKLLLASYDFIIVGAGSAGCVLANRLSEVFKWNVLLIEAGGYELFSQDVPGLALMLETTPVDWNYLSTPAKNYDSGLNNRQQRVPRGKSLGGSSAINYMIYTRGQAENYNSWALQGCTDWSFNKVHPYFKKLEDYTPEPLDPWFGHKGPVQISPPASNSDFATAFYKATIQFGIKATNINGPDPLGIDFIDSTTKDYCRMSANRAYLMPIKGRQNLHLKVNCLATQLIISDGPTPRTTGVQFICNNSTTYTITANIEVILSAGVFNSAQLLLLSGVGPEEDLTKLNITPKKSLPVGNNLQEHAYPTGIIAITNRTELNPVALVEYLARTGYLTTPGGIETLAYPNRLVEGQPALEYFAFDGSGFDDPIPWFNIWNYNRSLYDEVYKQYFAKMAGVTLCPTLIRPKSRGTVKLADKSPFSMPLIDFNFLSEPEDMEFLLQGVKDMIAIINEPSMQSYGAQLFSKSIPQCSDYNFGTDDYWRCHIRTLLGNIYHPCCTNKMGPPDKNTSVVDCELKVIGVDGLRVVDSSIMPDVIGGHLNIPTMMIAEKAADMIKSSHGIPIRKIPIPLL